MLKDGDTDPAGQTVDGLNYSPDIAIRGLDGAGELIAAIAASL